MRVKILLTSGGNVYLPNYRVSMVGTAICWFLNADSGLMESVDRDFPYIGEYQIECLDPFDLIYVVHLKRDLLRTLKEGLLCLDANSYGLLAHVAGARRVSTPDERKLLDLAYARRFPYLSELCEHFPRELAVLRGLFATSAPT